MANLLDLVNQLIGSLLQGNVYTNIDPYVAKVLTRPANADFHVPNTDPRPLNVEQGTSHPHHDSNIIHGPKHVPPAAMHSPPPAARRGMYQEPPVPPSVNDQKSQQVASPTPAIDRDKIYNNSDSMNRVGNPLNDLLDFHDSVAQDQGFSKGAAFDSTRRNDIFKTPDSNVGGTPISNQTLGDVQNQAGKPAAPSLLFNGPDDAPSRDTIAGERGDISANLFDDSFGIGGKFASLTQRPVPSQLRFADVIAAAHWIRNVGRELTGLGEASAGTGEVQDNIEGIIKGGTFLANQFLLASMNPGGILSSEPTNVSELNAVYNPLAIPASMLARVYDPDIAPIVAGPLFQGDYKNSLMARLVAGADLLTDKQKQSDQIADLPGMPSWFDQAKTQEQKDFAEINGLTVGPLDAGFIGEDDDSLRDQTLSDGEIYMPFMFEDLRDSVTSGRFLYFRAFLKPGLAETFTPDWQLERYYGRVDQIPVYQGTTRTINVAFDVVAWSPADLDVMWNKLKKLQSMVYPFYNERGFLNSGPIIRMRIGDLIAGVAGRGLPGYITSMDWSYDDGIWNLELDKKIPRKVSVSLGFTVLHDGNPGTYPYQDADLAVDSDKPSVNTEGRTFGAGKFTRNEDATTINVTAAEIRKIFKPQGS